MLTNEWLQASFEDDNWPIDYNHLKKIQDWDLGYVISDLHIKKIVQGQKLLELIENYVKRFDLDIMDKDYLTFCDEYGCNDTIKKHLQKLLEDSKK